MCNSPLPVKSSSITVLILPFFPIVAEDSGKIWITCFGDFHGGFVHILGSNSFKVQRSKSEQQEEALRLWNEGEKGWYGAMLCLAVEHSFKSCKNYRTPFNFGIADDYFKELFWFCIITSLWEHCRGGLFYFGFACILFNMSLLFFVVFVVLFNYLFAFFNPV